MTKNKVSELLPGPVFDCDDIIVAVRLETGESTMDIITIRDASINDAKELLNIYDYYVRNTAITFEVATPSIDEFQARMKDVMQHYPYIVIERDGRIEGYAYAHLFVGREAYAWSCETTIYIRPEVQKCGMGRMLYEALEDRLKAMGIINLYACIADPEEEDEYLTSNSTDFHKHMGYKTVGVFKNCGRKFGRWYTMIWMEKLIGVHVEKPNKIAWDFRTMNK